MTTEEGAEAVSWSPIAILRDHKALLKALQRRAFLTCPNCDEGMCADCSEANEALERIIRRVISPRKKKTS